MEITLELYIFLPSIQLAISFIITRFSDMMKSIDIAALGEDGMIENREGSRILAKNEALKKIQLELNDKTLDLTAKLGQNIQKIANDNISSSDLRNAKKSKSFNPSSCGNGLEQEKFSLFVAYIGEPNKWLTKSAKICRSLYSDKASIYNEESRDLGVQYKDKTRHINDHYEKEEITQMDKTSITPDSYGIPELHASDKEAKIAEITIKFSDEISASKIEFFARAKLLEDLRDEYKGYINQEYDTYLARASEAQEDSHIKEIAAKVLELQRSEKIKTMNAQQDRAIENAQNVLNDKMAHFELLCAEEIQSVVYEYNVENVPTGSSPELTETNDDDVVSPEVRKSLDSHMKVLKSLGMRNPFNETMDGHEVVENKDSLEPANNDELEIQEPIEEKLNSLDENLFTEFDDNPFTEGMDKIKELQKTISKDLRSSFSGPAAVVDTPVKFNEKQKELSVAKMVGFSKSLSQMEDKLGTVESYVDHVKNNIKIAEAALGEWKKRVKQAKKALKDEELGQKEVISFLKDEAVEMVKFINTVIDKEKKKIAEVSRIIQTFHLLNYKLKSGIFEETKPFLFDSSYDKQLEHLELSQELDIVLRKIEPNLEKKLMP